MSKKSVEIPQNEPTPQEIAEALRDILFLPKTVAIGECETVEDALSLAFTLLEEAGIKNPTKLLIQRGILEESFTELPLETVQIIERIKRISKEIAEKIKSKILDTFVPQFNESIVGRAQNFSDEPFGKQHITDTLDNSILAYILDSDQEKFENTAEWPPEITEFRKQFYARLPEILGKPN